MTIVPVKIRPHLIPFLFREFEGIEVNFLGKKVKACKITSASSLGFLIMLSLKKCKYPVKTDGKFYIHLQIEPAIFSESNMFNLVNGKNSFLEVPEPVNEKINNYLEDIFRIAFTYHSLGMKKSNPNIPVRETIAEFMTEYRLDEYGFNIESIRRLLDRGKENKISRMQNKSTHTILKT
jgi:hypothetical protein